MVRATFVMEQHLGHQTYYQNLRRFIDSSAGLQTSWVPVTYKQPVGVWDRVPGLPSRVRGSLSGRAEIQRGLQATETDVLFFNTQVPAVLGRRWLHRPYAIATDITPLQYDGMAELYGHTTDRFDALNRYKHHVNMVTLRGAAKLLPWSSWVRDSLIADYGVAPERIEVVPPGVDTTVWRPGQQRSPGPLRILFVGGDFYRKGGQLVLDAFRALPQGTATLVLVTRTPLAREEGVEVYPDLQPNTEQLLELYRTSDVFVLPSCAEAFGIAAVEASASGLPCIVTKVGGLSDTVVDGETGFTIQAGDTASMHAHLQRLVADHTLRERLGRAARNRVERYFDARRNAERVISSLLEVAQEAFGLRYPIVSQPEPQAEM